MVAIVTPMPTKSQVSPLQLNRILQLCSANLPVGGFSFSQGLEYAVEQGWVRNPKTTAEWVSVNLQQAIARTDLVIINRLYQAVKSNDIEQFSYWNQHLLACRESYELQFADIAMGKALVRLLNNLDAIESASYREWLTGDISFVSSFALTAYLCQLDLVAAQSGYCWTYIDNQIVAATKLVPLGQTQAQNLLFDLTEQVNGAIQVANQLPDDEIGASLPRLAMASAWHETQYTRLFRS